MKYISIDIETCGLDSKANPMIEFGAVWDDGSGGEVVSFRALIVRRDFTYNINSYCIGMHQELFAEIEAVDWDRMKTGAYVRSEDPSCYSLVCVASELGTWFRGWLDTIGAEGKLNVAGKNFEAFDSKWVRGLLFEAGVKLRRRVLDPAMLYVQIGDLELPNLSLCCARAGIEYSDASSHNAVYDAGLVVSLIRAQGLA